MDYALRIIHVIRSADSPVRRSAFYRKPDILTRKAVNMTGQYFKNRLPEQLREYTKYTINFKFYITTL